ncbi:glycosyltransferase, group 1 family protein [delta proteobacterium NaphS2]|nr:glycosyltransferase, group 1 family protein [delta proteobacterium NaphS2]
MHIAYLSASEIPSRTANSVHVMKMCNAFGTLGHQVVLYARSGKPAKNDPYARYGVQDTFPIIRFPWPKLRVVGSLIYIFCVFFHVLRSPRPDLFYSRYVYLIFLASFLGIPCIYEAHVFAAGSGARLLEKRLFRRRTFHRLVVISQALKKDYLKAYAALDKMKVIVAHDGADIPDEKSDGQMEKPMDGTAGLQVGYVGQLYPGKGMEIISQLAPRFPELTFHVVGGRDEDLDFWKERAGFRNLIFHGYVQPGDMGGYYRRFDIMLVPLQNKVTLERGRGDISRWTSPLKVFEAMAYGKAMVASDLPVLREVLQDGVTALMTPPDDIDSWSIALKDLMQNRTLMLKLGLAARKLLEAEYTWNRRVERVLS